MIPMKSGSFSDTGYRFRKNSYYRDDYWYPFGDESYNDFYDIAFFNSDTYVSDPNALTIAEMFFRIETNELHHTRIVK